MHCTCVKPVRHKMMPVVAKRKLKPAEMHTYIGETTLF
jgi:hypothetical protein